jgi:hypothetical protein
MSGKKQQEPTAITEPHKEEINAESISKKTCFIIMPIADHPDYETGHFNRVYEYLIKPACINAGYEPKRADDSKASHMIMLDILQKITECDMAICDISTKNANVFYELGLRQAFNKKTILITDGLTNTPFDITGFRYVKYEHTLRVDSVMNNINDISTMLVETGSASEDDVNSIVKLLKIQPARVEHLQLNEQDSLLFDMIHRLDEKMSKIEKLQQINTLQTDSKNTIEKNKNNYESSSTTSIIKIIDEYLENNLNDKSKKIFDYGRKNIGDKY